MAENYLKTPLNKSLNTYTEQKVASGLGSLGKSLPASIAAGASPGTVTVNFEVNNAPFSLDSKQVPVVGSRYVRVPMVAGDTGRVVASDAFLGGVTGLGGGVANYQAKPGNLSGLAFEWLGNTGWAASPDSLAVFITAPHGLYAQTDDGANKVVVNGSGVAISGHLGVFGNAPISQPTVTGLLSGVTDANAKAVLTSLITQLAALGLITNGTT